MMLDKTIVFILENNFFNHKIKKLEKVYIRF